MRTAGSSAPILERDEELTTLSALAGATARGEGAVVLLEGPAGIGKTALVRAVKALAAQRGLTVLQATGAELDRDYPFGLVHQLLDPVVAQASPTRRERLLQGAAARAKPVIDPAAGDGDLPDASHAVLHGLYWLLANLAEEAPLALLVDDLHWSDRPSLRLLEFIGRRAEGVPILIVGALRPNEPGAEQELLDALRAGPVAQTLRPEPLTPDASAQLVADALGTTPGTHFASASREATGGNPLLLRELARVAAEQGLRGTDDEAARVTELADAGLTATVQRRLATLGADAVALARAAAVLGERRANLDDLAAVAQLGTERARDAADTLAGAYVLDAGRWSFIHPLVREAVTLAIPPVERSELHVRAAHRLEERGQRPDAVAVHLLQSEPAGDPRVVATLVEAARIAANEGAPEAAVAHLARALREPPAAGERPAILLTLGETMSLIGHPDAERTLRDALEAGLAGDDAARAYASIGRLNLFTDPARSMAALDEGAALAESPAVRRRLEALLLDTTAYDVELADRRAQLLEQGRRDPDPSPVMLAHLAQDSAYTAQPAHRTAALARRALAGRRLLEQIGPESPTYNVLGLALRHAELHEEADRMLREGEEAAKRRGSRFGSFYMHHSRAYWELMYGTLTAAEAHARAGHAALEGSGLMLAEIAMKAVLADVLVERGELDEAERLVNLAGVPTVLERTIGYPDFASVRGLIKRLRGHREEAEADLRRARELLLRRGWRTPLKSVTGLRLAELLAHDRPAEALEILGVEEEAARRMGTPGTLGAVLRSKARVAGGDEGLALLHEAVETLGSSAMRLEEAWALHDLGAAIRRRGRPADARGPLRRALELATALAAGRLEAAAREELLAAGARPRRTALSGPEALTPAERRTAELAASGRSNREIAEGLWVTRKTVELHLGNAYSKLGIRNRTQLAAALDVQTA